MTMDKDQVVAWLERRGRRKNVAGLARYGIVAEHAFGVSMSTLLGLRKRLGQDHALALVDDRLGENRRAQSQTDCRGKRCFRHPVSETLASLLLHCLSPCWLLHLTQLKSGTSG